METFNSNSTKYRVTPENVIINYEFVRDYCGTLRGWISEFSREELEDLSEYVAGIGYVDKICCVNISDHIITETLAHALLHWLPVAIVDLPKYLHFGFGSGMNVTEISKYLKDYTVFCFEKAAEELQSNDISTRYDIRDSACWRNPDVVTTIAKHVFGDLHFKAVGEYLYNTVTCIMNSDRYLAMDHVHKLMRSSNEYDCKIGDILLHAINLAPKDDISNFAVTDDSMYCSNVNVCKEFDKFIKWYNENLTLHAEPEKPHKTLHRLTPEAMDYIKRSPVFSMEELERLCEPSAITGLSPDEEYINDPDPVGRKYEDRNRGL